ncbi:MAG: AraC family transcriptional regulator [Bryobacteraceae bacterium]
MDYYRPIWFPQRKRKTLCRWAHENDKLARAVLDTRFSSPAAGLERFVRFYVQREVSIRGTPVIHPVPARAAPMMEFDFGDPVDVLSIDKGLLFKSPSIVVMGPYTHRTVDLHLQGTLKSFVVMFQPDGLQRLFGLPMPEMTDRSYDARSVLGCSISRAWQILGDLESFGERVRLMNELLLRQSLRAPAADGISDAANRMIRTGGRVDMPTLAGKAGFSTRHFARKFIQQVGVRPKLFARIARFEAALENKARFATKSWTHIAHEFGYYDQMHMVHEFGDFTGGAPNEILTQLAGVFTEPIRQMRLGAAATNVAHRPRLIL